MWPIWHTVKAALDVDASAITAMKDPTRGGVASALNDMARKSDVEVVIEETFCQLISQYRLLLKCWASTCWKLPMRGRQSSA